MTDLAGHPEERLSALLDGELSEHEAAEVHAHVVACADCNAELDAVRLARASLRSLPAVDPPPGFFEALLATERAGETSAAAAPAGRVVPLRSRGLAVAQAAVAVAAGLLLVVGAGGNAATAVAPQVSGVVEQHASSVSAVAVGLGPDRPARDKTVGGVPRPYLAPEELAGYRLVDVFEAPEGVHLLYRKGPYGLSVFQQRAAVDFGGLPDGGDHLEVGGNPAWGWQGRVLVVEHGSLAVTLVGDESGDALEAAAEALPGAPRAGSPSWASRLRQGCSEALDMLSPSG